MPRRSEHVKAAKVLLGMGDPLIHQIMDAAIIRLGPRHRYWTHNMEFIKSIETLFGEEGKLEAVLHLLQDWDVITKEDYGFKDFRKTPRQTTRRTKRPLAAQ